MTRTVRLLIGLALAVGLGFVGSGSAAGDTVAGAPLISGCAGSATSLDGDGEVIARATGSPPHDLVTDDGEAIFTSDNPFPVSPEGDVEWSGESTSLIVDGTWTVKIWGQTLDDGEAANRERDTEKDGDYSLDGVLPLDARGLAQVEVALVGEGGTCRGTGFVKVTGSPIFTAPWLAGTGLVLIGLGLLFFAQPRQVWRRG